MAFQEKLRKEMLRKGLNQQRLARTSGVSDSEVSRILAGKSQPGLENALKLARAVGVSLDYLADDNLEQDPSRGPDSTWEREVLVLSRELEPRQVVSILMAVRTLGLEMALKRLYGFEGRPVIEVDDSARRQDGEKARREAASGSSSVQSA